MKRAIVPLFVLFAGLAGCTTTEKPAVVVSGPDCAGLIADFQEQLRQDVDSGKMKRDVYGRASADTGQAAQACSAGRQVQARSILIATKRNYGYEV